MTSTHTHPSSRLVVLALATAAAALLAVVPAAGAADGSTGSQGTRRAASLSPIRAHLKSTPRYPQTVTLTNAKVGHWAVVLKHAVARTEPSASGKPITTLDTMTVDGTQNIVLVLQAVNLNSRVTWYRVRLPILPNNSTGWVQRSSLSQLYAVHTHLYVDRATETATLKRNGVTIFKTRVGVGRPYWPTPPGQFYIRDKLTDFNDPFYGPVAFGTSARSAVLTDWPGGGFVGVHGTNEPGILPGHVSHGCVRMQDAAILKLSKLMPVGTPLTIR